MTKCNHCNVYSELDYGTCQYCGAPLNPFFGSNMVITASWSGTYPCLCYGVWEILVDGKHLPIPDDIVREPMNTFGTYQEWHFEDWLEVFEDYEDGLGEYEWIEKNKYWIDAGLEKIGKKFSNQDYERLYCAIQENDFRRGSCGGCIQEIIKC